MSPKSSLHGLLAEIGEVGKELGIENESAIDGDTSHGEEGKAEENAIVENVAALEEKDEGGDGSVEEERKGENESSDENEGMGAEDDDTVEKKDIDDTGDEFHEKKESDDLREVGQEREDTAQDDAPAPADGAAGNEDAMVVRQAAAEAAMPSPFERKASEATKEGQKCACCVVM